MKNEKIQKVLARAGYGSRRKIEQWICEGRIKVNGVIATIGERISNHDKIFIDNKLCELTNEFLPTRVLLYHKPTGLVTTRDDPEGRQTVFDQLPSINNGRWISIGRLDLNTSGLLLFTNNGELANRLMHPSFEFEREYMVRIMGKVSNEVLQRLRGGVKLQDGVACFDKIIHSGKNEGLNYWYKVMVKEGRNRLVRRLWESQGIKVNRLIRIRYGAVVLPKWLRAGDWLELSKSQIKNLLTPKMS